MNDEERLRTVQEFYAELDRLNAILTARRAAYGVLLVSDSPTQEELDTARVACEEAFRARNVYASKGILQ